MNNKYDVFIVGATVLGLGIIEKNKTQYKFAVAERGNVCAYEFSSAYKSDGNTYNYNCVTNNTLKLKNDLIDRDALTAEKGEFFPAIAPIISDYYHKSDADCFFMTNIIDIIKIDSCYKITLMSFGGKFEIYADRIIDTTSEFISSKFFNFDNIKPQSKSLNVYTTNGIYRHDVAVDNNDYSKIRVDIYNKFINDKIRDKIILFASEFDYKCRSDNHSIWYPSTEYGNFLESFDFGCQLNLSDITNPDTIINTEIHDGDYDVIVVGLGTAGAICAIAAAERGLKVLGIENLTCMGGQGTAGGVMGYYYGEKGGLYRTVDSEAVKIGESGVFINQGYIGSVLKTVALDKRILSDKYDITYKYHAMSTDVIKETDKKITGIKYIDGDGLHIAKAKFVIDCTAEAVVCISAGCDLINGRKSDGRYQPYSNVYFNYNIEKESLGYGYIDNGVVNHYNPYEYGKAVLESSCSYVHLKNSYADGRYAGIVPLTGLREGKHILGEQTVVFEKYIKKEFPDNIIYYSLTNLDNHGKDSAFEDRDYQDWITVCNLWGYGVGFPIPMGALIPKDYDGLLAAGRLVSMDHTVSTGIRMKDDVQKSGEVAAVIAALAIVNDCEAKNVPYDKLKFELNKTECLKDSDEFKIYMQQSDKLSRDKNSIWNDTFDEIRKGLSSDIPGYFIYCAKIYGEKIKPLLIELLNSDNKKARNNSALALGLINSYECESVILEMIEDKSGYIPFSGRKYNVPQSISAISIAGRLGLRSAVDKLINIIENKNYVDDIPLEPYDFILDYDDLYFQYISNSISSLLQIVDKHPDLKNYIIPKIKNSIKDFEIQTSMMGAKGIKLDVLPTIKTLIGD